jgi:phospholipase C
MKSFSPFWLISLFALSTLMLAGCGAGTGSSSNPSATMDQLTVAAPPAGAGTITSSPAGIDCPSTCSASFPQNAKVTLTATPGANYIFAGWGGACSGTTCVVTITAATSVSASFMAGEGVTVAMTGGGTGTTVTSSPAGINCPTTCSATFPKNTQVTLTETAGSNYFVGWGGSCSGTSPCSLTVSGAESVTATFSAGDALSLTMAGSGSGTVTSTPAGITCPGTCSAIFPPNTSVTLTETATSPNVFNSWSGACTGTTVCSVTLGAPTNAVTATFSAGSTLQSLNHIIILAQENRSLDSYFGYMLQYWAANGYGTSGQTFDGLPQFTPPANPSLTPSVPGCNPADPYSPGPPPVNTSCIPDPSNPIYSFHMQSICTEELSPFWNEARTDWNYSDPTSSTPALDGFVIAAANDARQYSNPVNDTNGLRSMGYFQDSDLPYYYYMASNFATSDRWFSPVLSRTQLNRMYILAGTSAGHAYPLSGSEGALKNETIFEALQNANPPVTWKIYVNSADTGCADTDSACLINFSYINMFTYYSQITASPTLLQNIASVNQFEQDAANGTLPQVALIEAASNAGLDEHPTDFDTEGGVNIQAGAQYVEGLINALMYSKSWSDSALIFTYDEDGGFYDHVPPQPAPAPDSLTYPIDLQSGDICDGVDATTGICSFAMTGYRVPMFVVSPFARKNYVSHTVRDTTAVLNLIEERFNIPALTARDAYWSTTTPVATMDEFFDFVNVPWATPPAQASVPQQQTNEPCSLSAPPQPPPPSTP